MHANACVVLRDSDRFGALHTKRPNFKIGEGRTDLGYEEYKYANRYRSRRL